MNVQHRGQNKWEKLEALADRPSSLAMDVFRNIERIAERNQWKVIEAFQRNKVSDFHFSGSTGYGYNDRGREIIDLIYAEVMGAEAAIVRPHFVSGTHTITCALFGVITTRG